MSSEGTGAEFGDRRLSQRLEVILGAALSAPGSSFPEMSGSDAALEGTYRFLNNDRVTADAILAPHIRSTTKRIQAAGRVIVAHDSTQFSLGPVARGDFPLIGKGTTYGIEAHFAFAVTVDEERIPLGVLAVTPFERKFGSPRLPDGQNKRKAENITHRWMAQVRRVRESVGDAAVLIHVMDREADDYALLGELTTAGERFIVRQAVDRRLTKRNRKQPKSRSIVAAAPLIATREVELSARRKPTKKKHATRSPLRNKRLATFEIRAARMKIPRTTGAGGIGPAEIDVNLVEAVEIDAPEGEEPVSWWLWTNEPIGSLEEVLAVIDAYRARWTIEEYFKALKSGCRIEQRQLESRHALLNALAIFASIAWRLLLLRSVARQAPNAPGTIALTNHQFRALRGYLKKKRNTHLPPDATSSDVLACVAMLGGHIANNGAPGWIVLGRGFERLLDIELGLSLATEM